MKSREKGMDVGGDDFIFVKILCADRASMDTGGEPPPQASECISLPSTLVKDTATRNHTPGVHFQQGKGAQHDQNSGKMGEMI